jgi:hypothetical protein
MKKAFGERALSAIEQQVQYLFGDKYSITIDHTPITTFLSCS